MDEENGSKADLQLDTFGENDDGTFGGDDRSSIQAEDDLRAKEKTPSEYTATLSAHTGTLSAHTASVRGSSAASNPETVVNFLCSFLSQMGMTDTLDCFQAEWHEMVENGHIDANQVEPMPNVYIQNRHLENELKNVQKEIEEYSQAITGAEEALVKIQKARDYQWIRHKRVVQEKNKLIEDIRKLTAQCNEYQPKIKQMNEKYQKLVQQTMNATRERDKALAQAKKHSKNPQQDSTSYKEDKETT